MKTFRLAFAAVWGIAAAVFSIVIVILLVAGISLGALIGHHIPAPAPTRAPVVIYTGNPALCEQPGADC